MSLRLRLIQTITIVLLGTLLFGGVLIYWHAVVKIETEMKAAIAVGGRIARNAVDDIEELTRPRRRLELVVGDFDNHRHLRAMLYSAFGSVLVRSEWSAPSSPAPAWLERLLAARPLIIELRLPSRFARFGKVIVVTDARNEIAEVWADAKLYLMLFAVFCFSVLAVLYLALGQALKPLQALLTGFGELGHGGKPEPIEVTGPTEIVQLARGFNDMTDRLGAMKDRNARLHEQLETVQEEERAELARNLHDEISPLLFSVDVDATNVVHLSDSGDKTRNKIKMHATAIKAAVALLKRNVKATLVQLRPAGLHSLSLKSTIEDLTTFWKARDKGLRFELEVPDKSWGVKIDSAVQSIVRESLSNAMKHAKPSLITITISEAADDVLRVEVGDNGGGFSHSGGGDGLGIIGMRERAVLLGGSLTVDERETPRGVLVRAALPLPGAAAEKVAYKTDKGVMEDELA